MAPSVGEAEKRSLTAELHAERSDEREQLLHEVLADDSNPMWDLLDQDAVRRGVDGWADIDLIGRREVFGAISAAIWARS